MYHAQLVDEQRQQRAPHGPDIAGTVCGMSFMQGLQAFTQDRKIARLAVGQFYLQRNVIAGGMAARFARLVLLAPLHAPRMCGGQSRVFRHQLGRHVPRPEHLHARADILFQQAHDETQAPP
ncbi:hypothetical protein G6F22_018007 [Rhizopus arrhizus]|nr:hypothetical protein G6F22_018007 [Rhizopus arrhizus]